MNALRDLLFLFLFDLSKKKKKKEKDTSESQGTAPLFFEYEHALTVGIRRFPRMAGVKCLMQAFDFAFPLRKTT